MKRFFMKNEDDTRSFGLALAERLGAGSVVALTGDLGTGKTALTRYIAEGLGIRDGVTSPSFTIIKEYGGGRLPLYHFDVYRIGDPSEMDELGYEEYFFGDGVCVVEWANLIEELLPEDAVRIEISRGEKETERIYDVYFGD